MRIIVTYDISNDRRRERLRKALLSFGNPVQKSVFECDLSARQLDKMARVIRSLMDKTDNIRYYSLCGACARAVEVFGGKPLAEIRECYVI